MLFLRFSKIHLKRDEMRSRSLNRVGSFCCLSQGQSSVQPVYGYLGIINLVKSITNIRDNLEYCELARNMFQIIFTSVLY